MDSNKNSAPSSGPCQQHRHHCARGQGRARREPHQAGGRRPGGPEIIKCKVLEELRGLPGRRQERPARVCRAEVVQVIGQNSFYKSSKPPIKKKDKVAGEK